jgi:hypothetical protein
VAEDGRRLDIWRWSADQIKPGGVGDLAIKSFYTMLNANGEPDGRIEELLGQVEQAAERRRTKRPSVAMTGSSCRGQPQCSQATATMAGPLSWPWSHGS